MEVFGLEENHKNELKSIIQEIVFEILSSKESNNFKEHWMNLGSAANYIGVSRNTFKKYIVQGEIKLYTIDGIKRIAQSELDIFIKSKEDLKAYE